MEGVDGSDRSVDGGDLYVCLSVCLFIIHTCVSTVCTVVDIISFLSTDLDDVYHARQYAGTEHSFQE